ALTHRQPGTIRQYLCGALDTPDDFLALLELQLGLRAPESSRVCGDEKTTTTRAGEGIITTGKGCATSRSAAASKPRPSPGITWGGSRSTFRRSSRSRLPCLPIITRSSPTSVT